MCQFLAKVGDQEDQTVHHLYVVIIPDQNCSLVDEPLIVLLRLIVGVCLIEMVEEEAVGLRGRAGEVDR